jgi:hypothetical protein
MLLILTHVLGFGRILCNGFNIKVDLREMRLQGMEWIHEAQDRDWWRAFVNMVNKPLGSIQGGENF